jgi:poly-gamma-glutamate capsule biosynthesis protein CapA/YwtB (metallophosphatase superfamily)
MEDRVVTLFVCGDVMLGRGIDQILAHPGDPTLHEPYMQDARDYIELAERRTGPIPRAVAPAYPWGDALALLDAARPDARIINLETSITRGGVHDHDKQIHYRTTPENAASLTAARIDACTLANNHVLDWGPPGLFDTLSTLDRLGIARTGAGTTLREAAAPAVIGLGARGRIVVFGVGCPDAGVPRSWAATDNGAGVRLLDDLGDASVTSLRHAIEPWRTPATTIVLSIHWGSNWGFAIPAEHRAFARRMIDEAGVHLVHGHSSHHVKGIEVHHGHPILYGCGDLVTDYEGIRGNPTYRGDLGLLYLVTLDASGNLTKLEMIPTQVRGFRINRARPDDVQWLATTLTRCGVTLGTSVVAGDPLTLTW